MAKRVSKKGFKAWLESFSPQKVVGYPSDCRICPLGRYTGGTDFLNSLHPRWIGEFVELVDESGFQRITASRALKFLARS